MVQAKTHKTHHRVFFHEEITQDSQFDWMVRGKQQ